MALWTPDNLATSLKGFWVDGNSIAGDNGDPIASFLDRFGNVTFANTSSTQQPQVETNSLNGLKSIKWVLGSGDDNLRGTWSDAVNIGTGDLYMIGLCLHDGSFDNAPTLAGVSFQNSPSQRFMIQRQATNDKMRLFQTGATIGSDSAISDDTPVLVGAVRTSSTSRLYINAAVQAQTTSTAANLTNTETKLGSESGQFGAWSGNIFELVVGRGTLSDADRQRIEGYLSWKWGLEDNLPSDHPYKTFPPTFTLPTVYWTAGGNPAAVDDPDNWSDNSVPDASKKCVFNDTASIITTGTLTAGEVRFTDGFTGNLGTPAAPIQITTDLLSIGADNASINVNSNSIADIYIAGNGRGVFIEGTATTITVESLDDITLNLTSITTLEVRHDSGAGGMISTQAASNVNVGYGGNVIGQGDLGNVDIFQGGYLFQHAGSDVNSIELYGGECLFHGSDIVRRTSAIYSGLLTTRSNQRHNVDINGITIYPNGTLDVSDSPLTEFSGAITSFGGTVILGDGYTVALS